MAPIEIGVLYSTTGTTAAVEETQQRAVLLAVEEINEAGGVLGRELRPVCADPAATPRLYGQLCEQMILERGIRLFLGCYMSSTRKAVIPLVERHDALLFYGTAYEGFEFSRNVFYGGAAPNQNILPLAGHMLERYGTRVAMVGSDYVCPYEANRVMSDLIFERGGSKALETYLPLDAGAAAFDEVARDILNSGADFVYSTVVGEGMVKLHRALEKAGLNRHHTPIASHMSCEADIDAMGIDLAEGLITCATYFESVVTEANLRAVDRYRQRFGSHARTNACWEAAYVQTHLLASAMAKCGGTEPVHVARAMAGLSIQAPQGLVRVDGQNHHSHLNPRIGRCNAQGSFDILAQAPQPVAADPYVMSHVPPAWAGGDIMMVEAS
ncbi:MAG: branched-chain amino acid transport system substrate-binding protein [Betaproteobacteria bacterium]|nr:branched-chain amino acid transport system substrate-binding protein [Betaproteobacteria bacterium]